MPCTQVSGLGTTWVQRSDPIGGARTHLSARPLVQTPLVLTHRTSSPPAHGAPRALRGRPAPARPAGDHRAAPARRARARELACRHRDEVSSKRALQDPHLIAPAVALAAWAA